MRLGFAEPHHKITPREKRWRGPGQGELPFNISATTEDSDFKIGRLVGFAKAHHKISPRRKSGRVCGPGSSVKFWGPPLVFLLRLKVSNSDLVHSLGGQLGSS